MDRLRPTSGQLDQKLIVAKLATIFDGSFTVNFWPSWPEVKWCPSWTPFPSEHGLSKRFPTWEPFLRLTSGQFDQKLIATMMVTVFCAKDFRPWWAEVEMWTKLVHIFVPGTSDQVDPKLEIRAMMARIIWPESIVKMWAKLAHIFRGICHKKVAPNWRYFWRTLLEMWDNLSHISEGETNSRNSGQVVRNFQVNTD